MVKEPVGLCMNEYRLTDEELKIAGVPRCRMRLCYVGYSRPKNGEHYGAPYLEEEWENDIMYPNKMV